jgi:hypothetical protein
MEVGVGFPVITGPTKIKIYNTDPLGLYLISKKNFVSGGPASLCSWNGGPERNGPKKLSVSDSWTEFSIQYCMGLAVRVWARAAGAERRPSAVRV